MISIRNRLLIAIFGVLMFFTVVVSILTYISAHEEVTEIFDKNMQQVAMAISAHTSQNDVYEKTDTSNLKGEEEFLIQIWDNNHLIYTSHHLIDFPLQEKIGYMNVDFQKEVWRYYQYKTDNKIIQVSQSLEERNETILEIIYQFVIPIFLQLPIMLALVYFFIGRGLQPLATISQNVKERGEHNLSPIDAEDAPQEIFPLINSLNQLLRRLENSLKIQRQFTADAAHELRTPLTAVKLQLDILERSAEGAERADAQNKLRSGVERCIKLVTNLLALARHEPEAFTLKQEAINLGAATSEIFENLRPIAKEKNLTYTYENNAQNAAINGQPDQIHTLIESLIQNALLYTQDHGTVQVSLQPEDKHIALTISDNGPGIPEDERSRVFDRFYRVLGTKKGGSGLGLSIVKSIADQHGATITIQDGLENQGCAFVVRFPLP